MRRIRVLFGVEEQENLINQINSRNKMFEDKELNCTECGRDFIWTSGEQGFMNGLYESGKIKSVIEPKRCPDCRQKKKARYSN